MKKRLLQAVLGSTMLAALASVAWANERVTLANGFSIDCHHHEELDGRVRLYLDRSQDSFIEVGAATVLSVDWIQPSPPVAPSPAVPAPQPEPLRKVDAPLTAEELRELMVVAGQEHNLDVDLLASVVQAESRGNRQAVSRAGARGLMQLMPATARTLGVADVEEPRQNLRGGSTYLDSLLTRYHENLSLALAAYNAGPAAVDKYHGIPPYPETQAYVARVIHAFNRRVAARQAEARKQTRASIGASE